MDGFEECPIAIAGGQAALAETRRYLVKRVTRLDLGVAPRRDVLRRGRAFGCAFGTQAFQPRAIHGLERQLKLKACARARFEITGRLQRAIAIEARAIALKAQRPSRLDAAPAPGGPALRALLERLSTGRAQGFRAPALELPTRKRNPFICRGFCELLAHESKDKPGV